MIINVCYTPCLLEDACSNVLIYPRIFRLRSLVIHFVHKSISKRECFNSKTVGYKFYPHPT